MQYTCSPSYWIKLAGARLAASWLTCRTCCPCCPRQKNSSPRKTTTRFQEHTRHPGNICQGAISIALGVLRAALWPQATILLSYVPPIHSLPCSTVDHHAASGTCTATRPTQARLPIATQPRPNKVRTCHLRLRDSLTPRFPCTILLHPRSSCCTNTTLRHNNCHPRVPLPVPSQARTPLLS